MIFSKWQICIKCCVEYFVLWRCVKTTAIPQFKTTVGDWVLLEPNFVDEQLLCGLYSDNITNTETTDEANPLTLTNLCFRLPDLHSCKEPFQVRIPWYSHRTKFCIKVYTVHHNHPQIYRCIVLVLPVLDYSLPLWWSRYLQHDNIILL